MQKITTFLTFDSQAEEAARLYTSLFPGSQITSITPYPAGTPRPAGSAMVVQFELSGQPYIAMNGGPHFGFSAGISLCVNCESQAEVDKVWATLTADGGEEGQCGWLTDKFGVSWQVVPTALPRLMSSPDREKAGRVAAALMQMRKIDLNVLEAV
ncbi:VOC family protein [Hymenobacter persicinus]|uniref:VOC family protein n=1 Tax=Hymenobacter persicinus TaxID=2025506 RepID=A0A4V1ZAA5_9BACT|nr:VOC family protein [Hymenobacter persicinus]RYU76393.1 VOC family protein [Hymenobacter persicinus]